MAEVSSVEPFEKATKQVEDNTVGYLYPLWMRNWQANLSKARNDNSLDKIFSEPPIEKCLIVGRGPSLRKFNHLDTLSKRGFPGGIIASDGALPLLAEHGLTPKFSITVDGSPLIAKWYTDDATKKVADKVRAILPLTVHPDTVRACEENNIKINWYIPELDKEGVKVGVTDTLQLQTYSEANPTGISRMNGAGCSGLAAIVFAVTILRSREIFLVGMDNGYNPDTPIVELHYHRQIMEGCGFKAEEAAKLYKLYDVPVWQENNYAIADPVFEIYRRTFVVLAQQATNMGVKIHNCTGGGVLIADGVEYGRLEDCLNG